MPFQSKKQERYMWSKKPKIARKWADEAKEGKYVRELSRRNKKKRKP